MRTVKEVSKLTGISVRTLRYYDEIGLLHPTKLSESGYRLYDDKSLAKLQEIMFFKELDIPLGTIRQLVDEPRIDRQQVLQLQKKMLEKKRNRLNGIIELIDDVMNGVNTMSFEAFNEEDIEKIVEHTVSQMKPEDLELMIEKYGSIDEIRAELAENLKDKELENHLIKLFGGKDKAVEASTSGTGNKDELENYQRETDEIYKQFALAMNTDDHLLKEAAVKRLAENNKRMFHFENVRYFLLQLADEIIKNKSLADVTDQQYGNGVSVYIAEAIREHYGSSLCIEKNQNQERI